MTSSRFSDVWVYAPATTMCVSIGIVKIVLNRFHLYFFAQMIVAFFNFQYLTNNSASIYTIDID